MPAAFDKVFESARLAHQPPHVDIPLAEPGKQHHRIARPVPVVVPVDVAIGETAARSYSLFLGGAAVTPPPDPSLRL